MGESKWSDGVVSHTDPSRPIPADGGICRVDITTVEMMGTGGDTKVEGKETDIYEEETMIWIQRQEI